jgi:hypothetical protein
MPSLTKTFDKTKTAAATWGRLDITPAGGALTKISCKVIKLDAKVQTIMLKQPDAAAVLRAVDEVPIEAEESIILTDIEEIDLVLAALGGSATGFIKGTAKLYIRSPLDAAGVVRYVLTKAAAAAFECSLKRVDGSMDLAGGDFTKNSLVCTNLSGEALVWDDAAAAPDA